MRSTYFAAALLASSATAQQLLNKPHLVEAVNRVDINVQPVIGVVAQPLEDGMTGPEYEGYTTYVMDKYIRFMETSGARVIPLLTGEDESVTLDKLSKVNGVLFPGGGGDYEDFAAFILDRLVEYNDAGDFFPAWGTCLGF